MNDFTKEELELLRDGLNYGVSNPYGFTADTVISLYNKIKLMIHNYSEIECKNNDCLDKACGKCRKLIG